MGSTCTRPRHPCSGCSGGVLHIRAEQAPHSALGRVLVSNRIWRSRAPERVQGFLNIYEPFRPLSRDAPHSYRVTVDAAVERFLEDVAVAKAAGTVNIYRSVLRRFAEFLDGQQPRPTTVDELTEEHPVGFARWVSDHGRAPRTTVQLYAT